MEPSPEFRTFIRMLGLRDGTAENLWRGDIHTPQELAITEPARIEELVSGPSLALLKGHILPALSKNVFPITIAADPYTQALKLIRQEAMPANSPAPVSGRYAGLPVAAADATAFLDNRDYPANNSSSTTTSVDQLVVQNGGNVPTHRRPYEKHEYGTTANVHVSGGTFVQSNILPQKAVYNNQNSQLSVKAVNTEKPQVSLKKLSLKDMFFDDDKAYHVDTVRVEVPGMNPHASYVDDPEVYPIKQWGMSRALIINNINFGSNMAPRDGAVADSTNFRTLLEQLGFRVEVHTDQNAEQIRQTLKEFSGSSQNKDASMILVFIGSHGERDNNQDWFVGTDNNRLSEAEVVKYFVDGHSPLIKREIPKLFFFQFCRQNKVASDSLVEIEEPRNFGFLQADAAFEENETWVKNPKTNGPQPETPSPPIIANSNSQSDANIFTETVTEDDKKAQQWSNMLFAFATAPGTKAYRDTQDGSWFVTALIKVFQQHAKKQDILSMLTMVNNVVTSQQGMEGSKLAVQLAEVKTFLTKKLFFFNPDN